MTDYPNNPGFRAGSPDTSREAAKSVADAANTRRLMAERFIRERGAYGATADEVAAHYDWERYSSRPRVAELHTAGKVADSGERRKAASGRSQTVWIIAPPRQDDGQGSLLDLVA